MIIQIFSENEKLLDLLHKNPNTDFGLYAKAMRNGQLMGMAVSPHQYDVVFQDDKHSYMPEEANQIDFQSYCSPLAVLHLLNELFSPIFKSKTEYWAEEISWLNATKSEIDTAPCRIVISNFFIDSYWYRDGVFLLSKYFPEVVLEPIVGNNYKLTVSGNSLFQAMNLLSLVSVLTHITNHYGEFTFIDDQFAAKYARILTNIDDVPYFVFYLFIKRAIKSERQFKELKPIFETYLKEQGLAAELTYYGTQEDRLDFILSKIEKDKPILDVGCGEFQYYRRLMGRGFKKKYYAVDTDPEIEEFSHIMRKRYFENNLVFLNDLSLYKNEEVVDIIASEVIEHNTEENAKALVKALLALNFSQLIITTPNADFNQFYFEGNQTRHDDHDFEFTGAEFQTFISSLVEERFAVSFDGIGDKINELQPTQVAIIKPLS